MFTQARDHATVRRWHPEHSRIDVAAPIPTSLVEYDRLRSSVPVQGRYFSSFLGLARFADQPLPEFVLGPLWEALRTSGTLPRLIPLGWFFLAARRRYRSGFLVRQPGKVALLLVHPMMLQLLPMSLLGTAEPISIPMGPTAMPTATLQEVRVVRSVGPT
ncbi:MAG: hypothetical protein IT305_12595 [Chloroflexi bacterium]|nr:hypothetical protein [Chloroflexota bacterium]